MVMPRTLTVSTCGQNNSNGLPGRSVGKSTDDVWASGQDFLQLDACAQSRQFFGHQFRATRLAGVRRTHAGIARGVDARHAHERLEEFHHAGQRGRFIGWQARGCQKIDHRRNPGLAIRILHVGPSRQRHVQRRPAIIVPQARVGSAGDENSTVSRCAQDAAMCSAVVPYSPRSSMRAPAPRSRRATGTPPGRVPWACEPERRLPPSPLGSRALRRLGPPRRRADGRDVRCRGAGRRDGPRQTRRAALPWVTRTRPMAVFSASRPGAPSAGRRPFAPRRAGHAWRDTIRRTSECPAQWASAGCVTEQAAGLGDVRAGVSARRRVVRAGG